MAWASWRGAYNAIHERQVPVSKIVRGSTEWWTDYLTHGHRLEGIARFLFPKLPSSPRCKICSVPFSGFGRLLAPFGWSPSRKNPRMCGFCSERLPTGGADVPVAVLLVDVCDYTGLSERLPGNEVAEKMNAFFSLVASILMEYDALVDKYLGDAVQALFLPGVCGDDFVSKSVEAATSLARELSVGEIRVRVAVLHGTAFVGNVGTSAMVDLTAMGDVVNTCHRLQGAAEVGSVIVGEETWRQIGAPGGWTSLSTTLKGKAEPVAARQRRFGNRSVG